MKEKNLEFVRVRPDQLDPIYEFHNRHSSVRRTRRIWEWEYGCPNHNQSILVGVKDGDRFVATQGILVIKMLTGKSIELTGKNESLLIDSAFRKTGLVDQFYQFAFTEYAKINVSCLWGFSRKAIGPLQRAGFKIYFNSMDRGVLVLDYQSGYRLAGKNTKTFMQKLLKAGMVIMGCAYSKMVFFISFTPLLRTPPNFRFSYRLQASDDLVVLFSQIRLKYRDIIHIHQDTEYYHWRVLNSPLSIQTIFLYKKHELQGYLYITDHKTHSEITEFVFIDRKAGDCLLRKMKSVIKEKNIGFITYTYNSANSLNKAVFRSLKKIGFIKIKGPNHFVLKSFLNDDNDTFFDIKRWYITDLWSEGI